MEQPAESPVLDVPAYLLRWPSWAAWTAPVKKPLDLRRYLRNADVTVPDHWTSFSHAAAYLARARTLAPPSLPLAAGVGLLVSPPLVFVDLDDLQPEPEAARPPWAEDFLQRAADIGAYTEWSGSGTGAHAFVRTSPSFPTLTRNRYTRDGVSTPVGVEVYTSGRFAALTGFPYYPATRPELNDPADGDALLTAFLADLGVRGAPVLSMPLGPIAVPRPSEKVLAIARTLAEVPTLERAFASPQEEFVRWAAERVKRSLDDTPSAWRFHLYTVAARESPVSPQPLYELFCPQRDPQHPGIPEWQEVSGYLRKRHRRYADIQRAHALVVEEQRLLALDLGEPPPPPASRTQAPRHPANVDLAQSWAQLGLAMKVTKNSAVPVIGSVNFIRCIQKHSHFRQHRIERNTLDGTTRVNREPLPDTLATRFLEPLRAILDAPGDPPIQAVRDAIEVVADDAPYDPLAEYLRGLPRYVVGSSTPLLSTWLERIGASPDPDLVRYSRRTLIGLVARALQPGVKFDYVPVFEGPTGVGKSTLVELIVTRPYWAVLSEALHSKDAKIALRGKWGLEIAEMTAFKKSDEEARKAFFSTPSDSFRPPYGRANIDVHRRCVLFGTTEDKQYLTDYRGNRRYWPIHFPHPMDLRWFVTNRDALFAEALYHYEAGEAFHDSTEEMLAPERLSSLQERLITPAWQVRILDHLRDLPSPRLPNGDEGNSGFLTTQYVANLQRVLDLPPAVQHMSDAQLATFLKRSGYHHRVLSYRLDGKSAKTYGWGHPALVRLTEEQARAFLSFFPALFPHQVVPLSWVDSRPDHLTAALQHLGATYEL